MNKVELIKELREATMAGMKDCNDALQEANFDLQKAIDIIKTKGKQIVSGRSGKIASEGRINLADVLLRGFTMVEVNCQTDFVANSPEFISFTEKVAKKISKATIEGRPFDVSEVESERSDLVARTKENIVIRRWWVQEAINPNVMIVNYLHSNSKIGVLMTILAPNEEVLGHPGLPEFAEGLAMQVAAMNPVAVSSDDLPADVVARQKDIFETQLRELNKPEVAWPKIMDGKFNKWYTEVCLLNQESIMASKKTVQQYIKDSAAEFGGEIKIVNFIRCQVGEGLDKKEENFADEVSKLI